MAKRFTAFIKSLRGVKDPNLQNEASAPKADFVAQLTQLKEKIPSLKEGLREGIKDGLKGGLEAVKSVPGRMPEVAVQQKFRDVITKYEKFTGVDEIMQLQRTVVEAQDKFIAAQDQRREAGHALMSMQRRLKDIHDEMQNTPKGDEKYLKLVTEEHKTINEEQHLRKQFGAIEREEREHFGSMSAAVKLSHERERAHAERNKYWYIVASLIGTAFGVVGSTMNNRIKMSEFRDMLMEQMERSNSVLLTVGAPGGALAARPEPRGAPAPGGTPHELEMRIAALAANQATILDHIRRTEKSLELHFGETKRLIQAGTASSAKSGRALQHALEAQQSTAAPEAPAAPPAPIRPLGEAKVEALADLGQQRDVLQMSFFMAFVALIMYGVIGKMS